MKQMTNVFIDQFAVFSEDHEETKKAMEKLGAKNWVEDVAVSSGVVRGKPVKNKLRLSFAYGVGPYEFEVLSVLEGETFHQELPFGFGHFGVHVDDADAFCDEITKDRAWRRIGYMRTEKHEATSNTYYYVFLENKDLNVFYKVIERLPTEDNPNTYSITNHELEILTKARNIFLSKLNDYGPKRYETNNEEFDSWMWFSDLYRKFIRLEQHFKEGKKMQNENIKDTLYDFINYSVLAIQMIERGEKK